MPPAASAPGWDSGAGATGLPLEDNLAVREDPSSGFYVEGLQVGGAAVCVVTEWRVGVCRVRGSSWLAFPSSLALGTPSPHTLSARVSGVPCARLPGGLRAAELGS
jgi:hypothetical protein